LTDRKYNGQKDKGTNNDRQNNMHRTE
jgi:hypothetical protein